MTTLEPLQARAKALHLHGLLAHWPEAVATGWVASLLDWEEQERARRSLERRLGRYEHKSTLITTNRPFAEWREVFPNAACVVSMVDRLMHNAEIVVLDGQSYRLKEAKERAEHRARQRKPPVAP